MSPTEPRLNYRLTFAVLALGTVSYALLQALVAPALPEIQHSLHTTPTGAAWILTAFLISTSVGTPIAGRLGDIYGKKRVLVGILLCLVVGSLVAALAGSLALLLAGRVLQGVAGAVFPLAYGIIRDEFPPERMATGIALISSVLGVGGGLGIVLAGPIVDHLSYHWLFWLPLVVIGISLAGTIALVPESRQRAPGRVSWTGALLLSAWLVCLLVGVSQAPSWGWGSARTIGLFACAVVLLTVWVVAESRSERPLVDMQMMRLRPVWTVNATALLLGMAMFSAFVLVPQLVELPGTTGVGFGASVTQAGLFLLPATGMMLVVSPIAGRLAHVTGSKVPLIAGAAVSTVSFVMLALAHGSRWEIYLATTLMGVGIGLAYSSMANLIVNAVPPEQTGVASGMNTIMRSIGGAIGGVIAATVLAASTAAGGLPTDHGFTVAFSISAVAMLVGLLASLAVPGRPRPALAPLPSD